MADDLRHDAVHGINGYRNANASTGTARAVDGGVDANQASGRVQQWPAGIAQVDGRIGLNQVIYGCAVAAGQRAVQCRHNVSDLLTPSFP